jgi:hypothetical protein
LNPVFALPVQDGQGQGVMVVDAVVRMIQHDSFGLDG